MKIKLEIVSAHLFRNHKAKYANRIGIHQLVDSEDDIYNAIMQAERDSFGTVYFYVNSLKFQQIIREQQEALDKLAEDLARSTNHEGV